MHYWRCINRLDYADKFCSNSVGFEENALKDAVCRALSEIFKKRANGMELVKSHLVYVASADDISDDLYFIDKAINIDKEGWCSSTRETFSELLCIICLI